MVTPQTASSFDHIWVKLDFANGVPGTYKSKLSELLSSLPEVQLVEQTTDADIVLASQVDENRMNSNRLQQVIVMNLFQPCFYGVPGADPAHSQTVRSFLVMRLIANDSLKEAAKTVDTVLNTMAFPLVRKRHRIEVDNVNKVFTAETAVRSSRNSADNSSLTDAQSLTLRRLLDRNQPIFHCGKSHALNDSSEFSVRLNTPESPDRGLSDFMTQLHGSIADLRSFGLASEGQDPDYKLEIVGTSWTRQNSFVYPSGPSAFTVAMDVVEPCEFHDPVLPARDAKFGNVVLTLVESREADKNSARKIAEKSQKEILQLRQKSSNHP